MPKQVIVIMDDHYPFGQCQQSTSENTRVLVRKIYQVSVQQRNKLLQKAAILRKLKCQQLIKIQSVLEEEESIHFLFQYVPIRLETWISNINDQFIENFRDQVIKFSSYLANNFIKIDFRLKNIGMDHNYGAKYFLDPSFIYDPSLNKQRLKSQYIRDITNLFKPYIESHDEQQQNTYSAGTNSVKNSQNYDKKEVGKNKNAAISPPTYNDEPVKDQGTTKTKEKLEKYYQQMNASMDVENEKILQEFMDVLDDEEEEQQHHKQKSTNQQNSQGNSQGNNQGNSQGNSQGRNVPPQYQYGYDPRQQDNKQSSNRYEPSNSGPSKQSGQNVFQNNFSHNQPPKTKQANSILPPPKMTKNSQFTNEQPEYQQQVVWRDGDDLQNRIKKAIQNSKSIIKRFKSIKQGN